MMEKLGYVVVKENEVNEILINKDLFEIKRDYDYDFIKPTLIIGREYCKTFYEDISLLDSKINENLYWAYSATENRNRFRDILDEFTENFYNIYIEDLNYCFIDFIIYDIKKPIDVMRHSNRGVWDSTYQIDDFLYMYNSISRTIYGLDINYIKELGYKSDDMVEVIKSKSNKFFIETGEEDGYKKTYEEMLMTTIDSKFLCVLLNNNK